ncbi:MAG: hypothetical protein FJY10_11415 [Bacteroidetes bacterium]|nr:hypothetical protein [Bacteroidota bacterium]
MNKAMTLQSELFRIIHERVPPNVSLVHDISELLGISYDSVYRRMRCEKELRLDEFMKLCHHYSISADALFSLKTDNIIFRSRAIGVGGFTLEQWLEKILFEIRIIEECREKEIIYAAKDLPIFYYFEFPEIAAFKIFFWHKALFPFPGYEDKLFSFDIPEDLFHLGQKVLTHYIKIPSIELWNEETITSIIRQVEYCYVSGFFKKKDDALRICDVLLSYIRHIQQQAEFGFRFFYGSEPRGVEGSFMLYYNEILLSDNTILVTMDGKRITYHTYNIINLLITTNEVFCDQIGDSLKKVMQESTLISGTSAKERNRFFNILSERVKSLKARINQE